MILNSVEKIKALGGSPEAALLFCMMWLQGGQMTRKEMEEGFYQWELENGEITWDNVKVFAEEFKVDAGIVSPLVNMHSK